MTMSTLEMDAVMEDTPVVIVGAGPSGLVLGLSLARQKIKVREIYQPITRPIIIVQSIVLEKSIGITDDPRGVYLAENAIRILYSIGIGHRMSEIGHVVPSINFHRSRLSNIPFLKIRPNVDLFDQTVPDGILQVQPRLESALRDEIAISEYCDLREACELCTITDNGDHIVAEYKDTNGNTRYIKSPFLVGADGKKGVVRKKFLEPQANIIQEPGLFPYEGTWIAANFKLTVPTPETHPDFPLWELGYTPSDVYDIFWPAGWHFCSPPGVPVACGRFGPMEDRLWRHEIAVPDFDSSSDWQAMFMAHVKEMVTRSADLDGCQFDSVVQYPEDCIEVLRCRPFVFAHKIVNKWFHNRTVLIGDAAHVFPPFGGQGIACGIGDAHGLAWRLALLLKMKAPDANLTEEMLNRWSQERRQSIYDSAKLTTMSGLLCNEEDQWPFSAIRRLISVISVVPLLSTVIQADTIAANRAGYQSTKSGFHLPCFGGGIRLPQVYTRASPGEIMLSDQLLAKNKSVFSILIIDEQPLSYIDVVRKVIYAANLDRAILSKHSIVAIDPTGKPRDDAPSTLEEQDCVVTLVPKHDLHGQDVLRYYDTTRFRRRIGKLTKFVIMRPDFIVYASATSYSELEMCLRALARHLYV